MKKDNHCNSIFFLNVFAYAQEIDSVDVSENGRNFKLGVRLGVNASYLDIGESGIFNVSEDVKPWRRVRVC